MNRQTNFTIDGRAGLKMEVLSYSTTWNRTCDCCNDKQTNTTEIKITNPNSNSYDSAYFALCHQCTNTIFFPTIELLECHRGDLLCLREEIIRRMEAKHNGTT